MSDSMGGITKFGMNFTPISSYNQLFQNDLGNTNLNKTNQDLNNFQNILDDKMNVGQTENSNQEMLKIGVSMDSGAKSMQFENSKVQPYQGVQSIESASPVKNTANNFSQALSESLNTLNNSQVAADKATETLAAGGNISVHDVMIASQKASLNMQMAMQLRNKIVSAYNEMYQMRF